MSVWVLTLSLLALSFGRRPVSDALAGRRIASGGSPGQPPAVLTGLILSLMFTAAPDSLDHLALRPPVAALTPTVAFHDEIPAVLIDAHDDYRVWWNSWAIGLTTLAVGQLAWGLATDTPKVREDRLGGSLMSTLGVMALLIRPPPLNRGLADLSHFDGDERRRRAEVILAMRAGEEARGVSLVSHALVIGSAIAYGAILWGTSGRAQSGLLGGAGVLAIGEARILTQPTVARDAYEEFQRSRPRSERPAGLAWGGKF